jgi:hypothetical protein
VRIAALAILLVASSAHAETVAEFVARWPRLGIAMRANRLDDQLMRGTTPCTAFDDTATGPPIDETTPVGVSPDGNTMIVVATVKLDARASKALGIVGRGDGVEIFGFDGPSGTIWARSPDSFMSCNGNPHGFRWSDDGRRVEVVTDTGRGVRVALVDLVARKLVMTGFAGLESASPATTHIAWIPWYSGFTTSEGETFEDELWIDNRKVWRGHGLHDLQWLGDTRVEYCVDQQRFVVTLKGARTPLAPAGRCS